MRYVRNRPQHNIRGPGGKPSPINRKEQDNFLQAWRPARIDTWPDHLPDPMVAIHPMELSAPKLTPREPHHEAINPGIRLGSAQERPQTRQEAETRYLRWRRTWDYIERHGPPVGPQAYGEAWPRQLRENSEAIARWVCSARGGVAGVLTATDMDDIYVDNALPVAREKWQPDKRDMSDYDYGRIIHWHNALSRFEKKLVRERSLNPPRTFGEIATLYNRDLDWSKRVYERAIDKVWRAAK